LFCPTVGVLHDITVSTRAFRRIIMPLHIAAENSIGNTVTLAWERNNMRRLTSLFVFVILLATFAGPISAQTDTGQCTVTGRGVNLRSGPGTNNATVGTLNDTLPVTWQSADRLWYQVSYEGQPAWVAAQVVTTTGNCNQLPVAIELEASICRSGDFRTSTPAGWLKDSLGNLTGKYTAGCAFGSTALDASLIQVHFGVPASAAMSEPGLLGQLFTSMEEIGTAQTRETDILTWTLYELASPAESEPLYIDLAVADDADAGSFAVLLKSSGLVDPAALRAAVFEPVLVAFEPLDATSSENGGATGATDCTVFTTNPNGVPLRVGPGQNRGVFSSLTPDMGEIAVSGKQTVNDGSLWYQLVMESVSANEIWVAADQVETSGNCNAVVDASAPPVIPARPPAAQETRPQGQPPAASPTGNHAPVVTGVTWQGTCQTGIMPHISWYDVDGDAVRMEVQQLDGSYFSHIGISGSGETSVMHDFTCESGDTCAGWVIVSDAAGHQSAPFLLELSCE
jgi:hypothetical protein